MKNILVIDDNPDILEALKLILELDGFLVKTLAKGELALQTVEAFKPNLIILDVLLSGADGRDICKALKKSTTMKKIPIIMISAHPNAEATVWESGADAFFPKPFDVGVLLSKAHEFTK